MVLSYVYDVINNIKLFIIRKFGKNKFYFCIHEFFIWYELEHTR